MTYTTNPHLWFKGDALQKALDKYSKIFDNFEVIRSVTSKTPFDTTFQGVEFLIEGRRFQAINADPGFDFNPSYSMTLLAPSEDQIKLKWEQLLANGGKVIMPLDKYPFSECYGWLEDEFGLSWQLFWESKMPLEVVPSFLFPKGKTKEALAFYEDLFPDFKLNDVHYMDNEKNLVDFSCFDLAGESYFAMDNLSDQDFPLNEAATIVVECETQDEVDGFWSKLAKDEKDGQCGWVTDPFGLGWQIVPKYLNDVFFEDTEKYAKLSAAMFQMKKLDLAALKAAAKE